MERLVAKITNRLVQRHIIKQSELSIYRYGLENFFIFSLEMMSVFIISIIIGILWETCIYYLSFIPLRIFAGGYHADTRLKCYLISLLAFGIFSFLLKISSFNLNSYVILVISTFSVIVIYILSPIVHKNKRISAEQVLYQRKLSLYICNIIYIVIICFVFLLNDYLVMGFILMLSLCSESIALIAVKNEK